MYIKVFILHKSDPNGYFRKIIPTKVSKNEFLIFEISKLIYYLLYLNYYHFVIYSCNETIDSSLLSIANLKNCENINKNICISMKI